MVDKFSYVKFLNSPFWDTLSRKPLFLFSYQMILGAHGSITYYSINFYLIRLVFIPYGESGVDFIDAAKIYLMGKYNKSRVLLYIRSIEERSPQLVRNLANMGFYESPVRFFNRYSCVLCIDDKYPTRFSKNWSRNSKRVDPHSVTIEIPGDHDIIGLMEKMGIEKAIERKLFPINKITDALQLNDERLMSFGVKVGDSFHCIRSVYIVDNIAFDVFACSDSFARKNCYTYYLMRHIICFLKSIGVCKYELSGLNFFDNPGNANFKLGTGSVPYEILGEFYMVINN